MSATEARIVWTIAVVGAVALGPASAIDSDPQALLEAARISLETGDVDEAAIAVAELNSLLEADPAWDPDGTFADRLLSMLEARIAGVRKTLGELRDVADGAPATGGDPGEMLDADDVSMYIEQARARIRATSDEIDRIVREVPDRADRCAVMLAEGIPRAVDAAEAKIFPELGRTVGEQLTRFSDDDERARALKARLDFLKREIVSDAVEREVLAKRVAESEEYRRQVERAMIALIGVDPNAPPEATSSDLGALDVALSKRIRDVWEALSSIERQSPLEREGCRETIERFRAANAASVARGGRDLGSRIDVLSDRLADLPIDERMSAKTDLTGGVASACLR